VTDEIVKRDAPGDPGNATGNLGSAGASGPNVAGISVLKGVILYGATFSFAGLYVYVITRILAASPTHPPNLDGTLIGAAAALAGVLGSAFALEIGTTVDPSETNHDLRLALGARTAGHGSRTERALTWIRQFLSLEPSATDQPSWPKTFGIWAYALIASAVAITYVTHQSETPSAIRPLAIAFAGYVLALIKAAYSNAS
jgi:hypothetical protein